MTTWSIDKEFAFSASHQLGNLPADHQCARLHGHNYVVRVQLISDQLGPAGFVLDYGELAPIKTFIDRELDHRHLNDVLPALAGPEQPSAELMAEWLLTKVAELVPLPEGCSVAVGISETPKTWAWAS